jgi:putative ABC transport system permease protein
MTIIPLGPLELGLASVLVFILAGLSWFFKFKTEKQIIVAAIRTTVQLGLVGLVLKTVFSAASFPYVMIVWVVMLFAAGREVIARQKMRIKGCSGFFIGSSSMFVSSFTIMVLILTVVIKVKPWYTPQYAIPMLGMMLGNTMNGIALGMNNFSQNVWQQRFAIEQRLALGQTSAEAIKQIWQESVRTGMIPIINAMSAAGLVSLPGMMTGQILAGNPVTDAVKYQILIMFMITAGTGFGVMLSLWLIRHKIFDSRERLRLNDFYSTE